MSGTGMKVASTARPWATKVMSELMNSNEPLNTQFYNKILLNTVKKKDLPGAWQVWRRMKVLDVEPDSETYSVLKLEGGGWSGLLSEMKAKKPLDLTTFILRAKNLSTKGDVEEGKRLLDNMKASGIVPNVFIYNTLLGIFGKSETHAQLCFQLFDEMKAAGIAPDVFTYNTLMDIKRKQMDVNGCFDLFEEMKAGKVEPDVVTYNVLLTIKSKQGDEVGCASLINTMVSTGVIPDRVSFNVMLSLFANRGNIEACRKLLGEIKQQFGTPDTAGYNVVLEFLAKSKDYEGCKQILQEMKQEQVNPDVLTLNIIMGNFQTSTVLNDMLCDIPRGLDTYNILINSAIAQQDNKTVIKLLGEMKERRIAPDAITYSTVLKGIIRTKSEDNDITELNNALASMKNDGVLLNIQAYHMLISNAAEKGRVDDCQQILSEMRDAGLNMDTQLYTNLMDKLAKQGYWKEVQQIFTDMKKAGVPLDAHVYSVVLMHTARHSTLQDCLDLCREMKQNNITPNAHTYSILMTACGKQKQSVELCFQVLEAMHVNHVQPVPQTYMPLIPLVFKYGRISHYHALYNDIKNSQAGDKLLYCALFDGLQALLASTETRVGEKNGRRGFTTASLRQLLVGLDSDMRALGFVPPQLSLPTPHKPKSSSPGIKDMLDCL